MPEQINDQVLKRVEANVLNTFQAFFILALTTLLIFFKLGQPLAQNFDEAYYIPFAQKYIHGIYHVQSHPPLGKMLIALGEVAYERELRPDFIEVENIQEDWPQDFDIRGFRIAPALFGTFVPLLVYLIVKRITGQDLPAFFAALLLALDTGFLSIARIAMLDVFLLFFILLSVYLGVILLQRERVDTGYWRVLAGFAVAAACAANVKDTGLIVGLMYLYVWIDHWRRTGFTRQWVSSAALFGGVFLFTYIGLWVLHFAITPVPNDYRTYNISETQQAWLDGDIALPTLTRYRIQVVDGIVYHFNDLTALPDIDYSAAPRDLASPWYVWPLGGRAINFRNETQDGVSFRYASFIGNPVTWALSLLGVVLGSVAVLGDAGFKLLRGKAGRGWLYALAGLYWAYLLPFWFIHRATYIYYYLPPLVLGLMLLALLMQMTLANKQQVMQRLVYGLIPLCFIAFFIYKPFIYYEPLTHAQFSWRIFWPLWNLFCGGCG